MDVHSDSAKRSKSRSGYSPDILRNNGDEKFGFDDKPEPDILQISGLVDEYRRVDEKLLKESCQQFQPGSCIDQRKMRGSHCNRVFNDGFFSLITDPKTLDFLISLGDYKQEETIKPSFHSKIQECLHQHSFSGQQKFYLPKNCVKDTATASQGKNRYAFQDAPQADTSHKNIMEHFKRIIPARTKNISNIRCIEEKKKKVEELKIALKETNKEKEELERYCDSANEQKKFESLLQNFESKVMNITRTAEETKLFQEELKTKMTKDLELVKDFIVQTQEAYANLLAKQKTLLEVLDAEKKFAENLLQKEKEIIFDLEDANAKYFSLKSQAEKELNDANKEYTGLDAVQQQEIHKLEFDIKRKFCTISALEDALDAKKKEHKALQVLCEELMKSQ